MATIRIAAIKRYPESGFVLVDVGTPNQRRMVYAPVHVTTRTESSGPNEALVLSTGNWGELTDTQRSACKKALEKTYPGRKVELTD
jgi:hypothetical protein